MPVEPAHPDELDAVLALVVAEQRRDDRNITYLGDEPDGVRAELGELHPAWAQTVRVARGDDGRLAGAALVEWAEESGRAWVMGPWVAGDDEPWARFARPLLDAVLAEVPAEVGDREMAGSLANVRLAALAADVGWPASETNYAYTLDPDIAAQLPVDGDDGLRAVEDSDLEAISSLHDAEFPASYASAAQVLEDARAGERVVLVAEHDGRVAGYAAGRVQPDGEGYIDFVAVDPAARGRGAGRRLVIGLSRRLVPMSTTGRVHLTVQEARGPARALYESLGFRVDAAFRGYRTRPS